MREFSVPSTITVSPDANMTDMVYDNASAEPAAISFSRLVAGHWEDVTAAEFASEVTAVAKGLIAAGIEPGDRIAIMSQTRYEWTLFDYAMWTAGAVSVPVYETSSAEQVQWILSDSNAVAVVVESSAHAAIVESVRSATPDLRLLWTIEDGAVDKLKAQGVDVTDRQVEERRRAVKADDLATIIYTSGTTGRPKGCELTHRNFLVEVMTATSIMHSLFTPTAGVLLFLPIAHVLGRVIQCAIVFARIRLGHTADIKNLMTHLQDFRPTFVLAVPRVFEKVFNTAKQRAHADGKGRIFDQAAHIAIAYSEALDTGRIPLSVKVQHRVFDRLVYSKLRAALGGRCSGAISGGAPLGERLGHFFRGIGLNVYEGYGLTETTAAACLNRDGAVKIGTVGQPLPGVSVRIADDGEVLLMGGMVFSRYWHNDDATADVVSDSWFHTGDIGELDDDGFLRITGRKKEIIVTAGGKNVSPAILEDRLRANALISQCMVVGDQKPFIAALITLDPDSLPAWNEAHGKPADTPASQLRDDSAIREEIQRAVDDANKAVSRAEAIKEFRILATDFTEQGGELTPSLKLKRSVVLDRYSQDVTAIYG